MGFTMPHITILIAAGVVGLALLFQIIGVATEGWVDVQTILGKTGWGLWTNESTIPDWLGACRAFGILGLLAMAASLVFAVLICLISDMKIFTLLAPVAAIGGAFCSLIEFAVFAGESTADSDDFGYSFGLTVVACVLCVVAAVLFFLGRSKSQ